MARRKLVLFNREKKVTMLLIGLGAYSRVGKDSFADFLTAAITQRAPNLRVVKRPLSWKLKQIACDLYAWAGMQPPEHYETREGEKDRDVTLPALGMTPVELWVALGTKAIRNNVYDRTWLDYLLKTDHKADVLIVPDIRFPNEAAAVKDAGGVLIKIVRPGYGPRKTVADRALVGYDDWDYVLGSEGTMQALDNSTQDFADWITGYVPRPMQTAAARRVALAVEKIEPWESANV